MHIFNRTPNSVGLFLLVCLSFHSQFSFAQTVRCQTEHGRPIEGVTLTILSGEGREGKIIPEKRDHLLEGVTILDLILICKHIIGLEPLESPYQIIASDVDLSGTIAPYDVLLLRRLILGIYDNEDSMQNNDWPLSHAQSWRFVSKNFSLNDPLQSSFPEYLNGFPSPSLEVEFVAIKTGDVLDEALVASNPTVTSNDGPAPKPNLETFHLFAPNKSLESGAYLTLPLYAQTDALLNAWQMGIRFDHQALEFVGVSLGDIPRLKQDNFGLTKVSQGEIRALWMANLGDEYDFVRPGQVMFYLTFRAKTNVADISKLLRTDDDLLRGIGYATDKSAYRFEISPSREIKERANFEEASDLAVLCRPNPSAEGFTLDVTLPEASKVRLVVYDAFGRRMLFREMMLTEGQQSLAITEASLWPAGVYRWDLRAGKILRSKGHAVKL